MGEAAADMALPLEGGGSGWGWRQLRAAASAGLIEADGADRVRSHANKGGGNVATPSPGLSPFQGERSAR